MKEWFTVNELAGLPGLPTTPRRVLSKAVTEQWQAQKRTAGKGYEYHLSALPKATQQHLSQQALKDFSISNSNPAVKPNLNPRLKIKEQGLKQLAGLPDHHPKLVKARMREWLVLSLLEYAGALGEGHTVAVTDYVAAYSNGLITIPDEFSKIAPPALNPRTLLRWLGLWRDQGVVGLLDNYGNRKGQSLIANNKPLKNIILGCLFQAPHSKAHQIKAYLEAEHTDLNTVSEKSIQRFIVSWKKENDQLWLYMTNPDKWKNIRMCAFGSHHENVTRLNQEWEMDSTPADWMLIDGRHSVIGVIDMYSRRLKFRVSKTSKASAVCLTFRDAVIAWGVPETVRTDNGKDYVSEQFATVVRDLELVQELCPPFVSEAKGTIERAMRTMSHGILELLPGFIGHNVAERKVIEARQSFADRIMQKEAIVEVKMTAADLQQKLDDWCQYIYSNNKHKGLRGKTPVEVANAWREPIRKISDIRALDLLLQPLAGLRTVTKKGIQLDHYYYIAAELIEYVGKSVSLRRDEDNIGIVYVYNADGLFVCAAKSYELLGISSSEVATVAKQQQKQFMERKKREYSAAKKSVKKNISEAVIEYRISQSENITQLPKTAIDYNTDALTQAGIAARSQDTTPTTALSDSDKAELQQWLGQPASVIETDTAERRYARMMRIQKRFDNGESLDDATIDKLTRYKQSNEYKTTHEFYREFDLSIESEA